MPMVREGSIIVPWEMLSTKSLAYVRKLFSTLEGKIVFLTKESSVADVVIKNKYVLSVSISPMSLIIVGDNNLETLRILSNELIYIAKKPFWVNTCRFKVHANLIDVVEKIMDYIDGMKRGCICLSNSVPVVLRSCSNYFEKERIICLEKLDNLDPVKVIPVNTAHPVVYGLLELLEPFDEDYRRALSTYISSPYTGYDVLAYVKTGDGRLEEFVAVNNRFKKVRILYVDKDLVTKILLQSIMWVNCE